MEQLAFNYEPLDLDQVAKSLPKNLRRISSEKDLVEEIQDVSNVLKDLSKCQYPLTRAATDWKKRTEALHRI